MTPRGQFGALVVVALAAAAPACAQGLDARVARASGEVVQFHYAAREGVCGDGRGMLRIESSTWMTTSGSFSDASRCEAGPVRALITKDGSEVLRVQFVAGPLTAAAGATDIGAVPAQEAARYFLELARTLEGRAGRSAVLGAALADSADIVDPLLAIARDADRSRDLRTNALSWAARRAGVPGAARMASSLEALARDANQIQQLRSTAISSLAGLEGSAGTDVLMRLTEAESDAWLAATATDALARTSDARVRPQLRRLIERAATPEASRVRMINALGNSDGTMRDAEFLRATYARFTERERGAALTSIGNIGGRASAAWLLVRVNDAAEPMALRRMALQRAARAGVRTTELAALYETVPERELRMVIVDELASDGSRPALDKLLEVARGTADVQVRRRAITKLSESGDPRAKELLQQIVNR